MSSSTTSIFGIHLSQRKIVKIIFVIATIVVAMIFVCSLLREEEPYKPYMAETEKLQKDNEPHRVKYPFQDVSQKLPSQQYYDYQATVDEAENLAKKITSKQKTDPTSLLPHDVDAAQWGLAYPKGEGSLELKNLLQAGTHLGVNTQGSSLKNANLQLRSEPPNPIYPVSIFNNSTITPNMFRKPLEIGEIEPI